MPQTVLDFASEAGVSLTPVQRVVIKLMYGLDLGLSSVVGFEHPLSGDRWSGSEVDYRDLLLSQGRLMGQTSSRKVALAMGRRSGKDTLLALVSAYEAYLLTESIDINPLQVLMSSPVVSMTGLLLDGVKVLADNHPELSSRKANEKSTGVWFQTLLEQESQPWKGSRRQAPASVSIQTVAALHTNFRGRTASCALFNEADLMAQSSWERALDTSFEALRPEGLLVLAGTPVIEGAALRHLWGQPDVLSLQVPTWEARPDMVSFLREQSEKPTLFGVEYGADFPALLSVPVPRRLLWALERAAGQEGLGLSAYIRRELNTLASGK